MNIFKYLMVVMLSFAPTILMAEKEVRSSVDKDIKVTQALEKGTPSIESLVDLKEAWGLNLDTVDKRQKLMRQKGVGDDVTTHILLLRGNMTKMVKPRETVKFLKRNKDIIDQKGIENIPNEMKLQMLRDDKDAKNAKETLDLLEEVSETYIKKILEELGQYGLKRKHLKALPPL